jgi:hypothetical protein
VKCATCAWSPGLMGWTRLVEANWEDWMEKNHVRLIALAFALRIARFFAGLVKKGRIAELRKKRRSMANPIFVVKRL